MQSRHRPSPRWVSFAFGVPEFRGALLLAPPYPARRKGGLRARLETRLQVGQDRIKRRTQRDQEPPRPLAIASTADVALPKARGDPAKILPVAADIAALPQIFGARAGIAIEASEHFGDVAIDIMHDGRRKCRTLTAGERHSRMNPLIAPSLGPFAKERCMSRPPKRRAPSPAHEARTDVVVNRDQIPTGGGGCYDSPGFSRELWRDSLIGVDLKNPVPATGLDPGVTARPFPLPGPRDDTFGETECDLAGAVMATVEHDNDFVRKGQCPKTVGKLTLFIMSDDKSGKARSLPS